MSRRARITMLDFTSDDLERLKVKVTNGPVTAIGMWGCTPVRITGGLIFKVIAESHGLLVNWRTAVGVLLCRRWCWTWRWWTMIVSALRSRSVTWRSDVLPPAPSWNIGATCWQTLAGQLPSGTHCARLPRKSSHHTGRQRPTQRCSVAQRLTDGRTDRITTPKTALA